MRIRILLIFILISFLGWSQNPKKGAFKSGETLHYKMSYSGFLKAGTATLSLKETQLNGNSVYHAHGFGKTTGIISLFFKVEDT